MIVLVNVALYFQRTFFQSRELIDIAPVRLPTAHR
jgi:hypothetical protein